VKLGGICPATAGSQNLKQANFSSDKAKAEQRLCAFASISTQYDGQFAALNHMPDNFSRPKTR